MIAGNFLMLGFRCFRSNLHREGGSRCERSEAVGLVLPERPVLKGTRCAES